MIIYIYKTGMFIDFPPVVVTKLDAFLHLEVLRVDQWQAHWK